MGKNTKVIGLGVLAAAIGSSLVFAQTSGMPAPLMPGQNSMQAPVVVQPSMPVPVAAPVMTPVQVSAQSGAQVGVVDGAQANTLRLISEKKAQLELLKIQAEIDKFLKPQADAVKKEEAASLQAALDQAKKEQSSTASSQPSTVVEQGPTVMVLSTYGMPDVAGARFAEMKVGEMLVHAKVGERLPSGHYVKSISFDSVEISKSKTAKRGDVVYISPSDAASVYGSRAKSGQQLGASGVTGAAPNGLPPMPASR